MSVPESVREALADRYAIEREIGRGGMAVVYLAHDLRHDRSVALKILLPDLAGALGPERFQREIYFAARLQHPHILTVLDSGQAGTREAGAGQLWFTMPFVEGESLRERLRREHQLPVGDALRITTEAARALDYAHQHGVIHRDIKPENILLTRDGTTLVADFGIARALGGDDGLTRTGVVIGTPVYMSPEQTDEKEVDARSDLYSLASVLYEMLAGEPPFAGRSLHAIVAKRITEPTPSVRTLRDAVPTGVDEAIRKAMAPEPADRFATVAEFAQALHAPMSSTTSGSTAVTGSSAEVARVPAAGRRRLPTASVALVATLLIGVGALFAWRRMGSVGGQPGGGTPVIAVLPFENMGDSADDYFADGVTEAVRGKLARVAGLEVIARGSSNQYRHTTKPPQEIAGELGADYLLTATVRWEKTPGGGSRVRVTPELVDVGAGRAPRTRWQEPFDASLTDVFQVQADIAANVASALNVALADSARRELAAQPTQNLAAYDAFLKGEAASQGMSVSDPMTLRRAIGFYERAVALDSLFATAWARLSHAQTRLYANGVPDPALGEQARLAAERARRLKPNDPLVYRAFGTYYSTINPVDLDRALAEYEQGIRVAPDNVVLLGALGVAESNLGRWDSAATLVARAALLDPRSADMSIQLADILTMLRLYARADSAADRALALAPTNPRVAWQKVVVALGQGHLDSARAVIRASARQIDPGTLFSYMVVYQDLYWVLDDEAQRQVLALPPSAFDDDRGTWGLVRAQLYHLRGDRGRTAIYADSARIAFAEQSRAAPEDAQRHALLGVALAYLGRKADAVREGQRAVELQPISRDAYSGPYYPLQLARIYLLVGEPEKALDQLEPLLRMPYYLSPGWLRIDPTFGPLRKNPRFQRLMEGSA